jgi:hypothetical protein
MLRARDLSASGVDTDALVEYLAFGAVLGARTFLADVAKLRGHEILELPPAGGGPPRLRPKRLPDVLPGDPAIVLAHFAALAQSITQGRAAGELSVDATGGFDSRLVVSLLHRSGLPFELATSGRVGNRDVEIAQEMARQLGRPFRLAGHDLGRLDEELALTFEAGDGLTDLRRFHRDWQAAQVRLARGIGLIAYGGGGELLRDHAYVQDFPFLGSSRVNFKRFYELRMTPVKLAPDQLSLATREHLATLQRRTIAAFEELRGPTNNQTHDRIYLFLRYPEHFGQHYANYINMGLDVAAPLLDYCNAQVAIATSPWRRVFFRWHREIITRHCPNIASLPTADGFTASNEPRRMLADLGAYGFTQLRRAGKKLSQRQTGKARFYVAGAFEANAPNFMQRLRTSRHFAEGLERLKARGILAPDLAGEQVRDIHVGRLLTLGMLLGRVKGFA